MSHYICLMSFAINWEKTIVVHLRRYIFLKVHRVSGQCVVGRELTIVCITFVMLDFALLSMFADRLTSACFGLLFWTLFLDLSVSLSNKTSYFTCIHISNLYLGDDCILEKVCGCFL